MEDNHLELTEKYIFKGQDLEKIKSDLTKNSRKYSGYFEEIDFTKGCTISPKTCNEMGYLYVATYVDHFEYLRPKDYKFSFHDKKIGLSYDVTNRMRELTEDIKIGRKNKYKGTKTITPLVAKAIKCFNVH